MTETPRPRHHLPADYQVGAGTRELELAGRVSMEHLADEMERTPEPHLSVWTDWAAELREREGLSMEDSLRAAQILYFG